MSYDSDILEGQVTKTYIDTGLLNEEMIKKYLGNGREVKASGKETLSVTVVQLEQYNIIRNAIRCLRS